MSRFSGALDPNAFVEDEQDAEVAQPEVGQPLVAVPAEIVSFGEIFSFGPPPGRPDFDRSHVRLSLPALEVIGILPPNSMLGSARGAREQFSRCSDCRRLLLQPHAQECRCHGTNFEPAVTTNFTTVMLKNLPAGLTYDALLARLEIQGVGDFVYMPMDFKNMTHYRYAQVNALSHELALALWDKFDGNEWDGETVEVAWGTERYHHSKEELIQRYRNSDVMHKDISEDYRPRLFDRHGRREAFPRPEEQLKLPKEFRPGRPAHAALLQRGR